MVHQEIDEEPADWTNAPDLDRNDFDDPITHIDSTTGEEYINGSNGNKLPVPEEGGQIA